LYDLSKNLVVLLL